MRASVLCLLAISMILGCQPPKAEAKKETPPPIPEAQIEPSTEVKETPSAEEQKQDPRYKKERIYQLADFAVGKVRLAGKEFRAWIADDPGKQSEGMMWLLPEDVKDDEGMLFIMEEVGPLRFWMRNCPMALDIIYMDKDRRVLNIGVGKPFDESGVPSAGPAKYVFELKMGMAKKFGIKKGQTMTYELPKK